MSIESAINAINLVGKQVIPAQGTERWSLSGGNPRAGTAIATHIPDIDHPYVVCDFGTDTDYMYPFELLVITPQTGPAKPGLAV